MCVVESKLITSAFVKAVGDVMARAGVIVRAKSAHQICIVRDVGKTIEGRGAAFVVAVVIKWAAPACSFAPNAWIRSGVARDIVQTVKCRGPAFLVAIFDIVIGAKVIIGAERSDEVGIACDIIQPVERRYVSLSKTLVMYCFAPSSCMACNDPAEANRLDQRGGTRHVVQTIKGLDAFFCRFEGDVPGLHFLLI